MTENQIEQLLEICFKLDDAYIRQKQQTSDYTRMAQLARAGEKDSKEFKTLDSYYRNPTVIDMSDTYLKLHKLMSKIRGKI